MLDGINVPVYVIFAVIGYFCGWCFRDIGIIKIIVMFMVVPSMFQWVMMIDEMLWVTLPFLAGFVIGLRGFGHRRGQPLKPNELLGKIVDRSSQMFRWRR